mgnify:CR=1 FL=1
MELHEIFIYGVAALTCFILAVLVRGNRQAVLQFATDLINKAEVAIQGSGMGADKKALVIAQLQAAGIKVTAWLDRQIDIIVASLNSTGAWLATQTQQGISGLNSDTEAPNE